MKQSIPAFFTIVALMLIGADVDAASGERAKKKEKKAGFSGQAVRSGASLTEESEAFGRVVARDEAGPHYPISAARLEAIKRQVYVDPDVAAGRDVGPALDELPELEAAAGPDAVPEPVASAPRVLQSFDGLNRATASHEGRVFYPPDTNVAAGPSSVLEATNVALRLSDRSGRNPIIQTLNDFFGELSPPTLFDPKVYYDRLSRRYFVVALSRTTSPKKTSRIWLAVSRSSNPSSLQIPSDWCGYWINAKRASWADYPGIGANENWFAIGVNNFKFSGSFKLAYLYVLPMADLVDNATGCSNVGFHRFPARRDARGWRAFTVQPAQHYSRSNMSGTPIFFVSVPYAPTDEYVLWRLQGPAGRKPTLSKVSLDSGAPYDFPPLGEQRKGLELDTGDVRVMQTAYRNGLVWAVHTSGCSIRNLPNESCVRVVAIEPTATGGQVVFTDTFGRPDWFLFWPGLGVNQQNDVLAVFQQSKANRYLGTGLAGMLMRDSSFGNVRSLKKGKCTLDNWSDNGYNRTGDYVGVQTDPADDRTFWVGGEYTKKIPGRGCDWWTRIGRVGL